MFFDANSGTGTITTSGSRVCRSITCTGFTGTLSLANTAGTLAVGDASGGALTFSAGMTLVRGGGTTSITFNSTSTNGGAGWGITTNGQTMPDMTFAGAGGKWVLQDALSISTTEVLSANAGELDTNGFSVIANTFSSTNSTVRTLTFGSSSLTFTGTGTVWNTSTVTNLTVTANTAAVTLTAASHTFNSGAVNWNGLSVNAGGTGTTTVTATGAFTVANWTQTGGAANGNAMSISGPFTVTNNFTVNGNSRALATLVQSNTVGTSRTITCNGTVSTSNSDWMDITGAGSASWDISGATGGAGDSGGNSGITFTSAVTRYWVGGAGNWGDTSHWSASSGGSSGASQPLPQDTAIFDSNSGSGTTTASGAGEPKRLCKDLTVQSGFTGLLSFGIFEMYGSVTLIPGSVSGNLPPIFRGRGSHTITSAGIAWQDTVMTAPGGTYSLQDAYSMLSSAGFTLNNGTFTTNSYAMTGDTFSSSNSNVRAANFGTTTYTFIRTSATWSTATTTNFTLSSADMTIIYGVQTNTTRTFAGGGQTYGTILNTVADSPGPVAITGANTLNTIEFGAGKELTFPASTTTTVSRLKLRGQPKPYVYLPGVSGNYLSSADATPLDITSDIDIRVKVAMISWVPAAASTLLSKWGAAGQRSYRLFVTSTGLLQFQTTNDGTTTTTSETSSVATGIPDGGAKWTRVTWRQSDGRVQFFLSDDGSSWTQLGPDGTGATSSIFNSTTELSIGRTGDATDHANGRFHRAQVYNGIDGTLVFDADLSKQATGQNSFTESSLNAATVDITGGLARKGDGRVEITSSTGGTPATLSVAPNIVDGEYLRIQDSTATGGATFYAGNNSVNVSGNTGWIFSGVPLQFNNYHAVEVGDGMSTGERIR